MTPLDERELLDGDGWRARIGLILPSINTVVEPWFNKEAPEGVSFHASRMLLGKQVTPESVNEMSSFAMEAARQVATCGIDLIAYCCTAASLVKGPEYDEHIRAKFRDELGLQSTTATTAILAALQALGVRKVVTVSPYTEELDKQEVAFFTQCGLEVVHARCLGISSTLGLADPSPGKIYRFARTTWQESPGAEALLVTCLNFRAHEAIQALEDDLGVPVITSTQATLWHALRLCKINDKIGGYGRLLLI